jgi:hypothetical protein
MIPVPARAKGLPSRLPETKGWGRGRGGKWVRQESCKDSIEYASLSQREMCCLLVLGEGGYYGKVGHVLLDV